MIVDVNTRIWDSPEQLGPAMARRLRTDAEGPWALPDASGEAHDEAMRPAAYAFLFGVESKLQGASIPVQRIADHVRRCPSKYLGVAGIDPTTDGALDKVDQAVGLGLHGVLVSPTNQGFHPTHSRALRLYEQCHRHGLPLFVDLSCLVPSAMMEFARPHLLDAVAREFPTLRLVVQGMGDPFIDEALTLVGKHEHAYTDICGLTHRPKVLYNALILAHQCGLTHRILLGTGFPFSTPERTIITVYSLNSLIQGTNLPTIPREHLRSIVERDALACLNIPYPKGGVVPSSATCSTPAEPPVRHTWEVDTIRQSSAARGASRK